MSDSLWPLSMGFSRQEYWSEFLFPSPGDLPNPGIKPGSPTLQADASSSEPPGKPINSYYISLKKKNGSILIIKSLKWRDILLFIYLLNPFLSPKTSSPTLCVYVSGAKSSQSLCDPTDCIPPGFSVHGILQARILEWIAFPFSRESSQPRDWTWVSRIVGRFFTVWATWEAYLIGQLPYRWPSL